MAIAAMILGILSGLGLLGWGLFGYFLGGLVSWAGDSAGGLQMKLVSMVVPVAVLVGAGLVLKKPVVGGVMMLGGALVILFVVGFNAFGGYVAVPALIAGILGIAGARENLRVVEIRGSSKEPD